MRQPERSVTVYSAGPTYGSDDGGCIPDDDGEPLVRVQSGVKKVEAITMLWTRKSLIVAYVR